MGVEIAGIVALAIGIVSLFAPLTFIIYAFWLSTLLAAAATFDLDILGGANITPSHILLGFLAIRLLSDKSILKRVQTAMALGRPAFWLLLTLLYSFISAYFLPRLFQGQTFTMPVRAAEGYGVLLGPSSSNFTQSVYFASDFICFVILYGYASDISARRVLGSAALALATLNLAFAGLDMATYWTHTTELLAPIRNAHYTLFVDDQVAGFKRIAGSFTEASSFGSVTLGCLAFTSRLWLLGIRRRYTGVLSALSLLALLFSTSTTAYVGLAAYGFIIYMEIGVHAMRKSLTPQMWWVLIGCPLAIAIGTIIIALNDNYSDYALYLLDTMVLGKMSTASGMDRAAANSLALQSFFDTGGFGVGNGSVRASSFPIAVLASLGVFGAFLFSMFFMSTLFSRPAGAEDQLDVAYRQGAKSVCIVWVITATIAGPLIDLTLAYYAFAALASGSSASALRTSAPS